MGNRAVIAFHENKHAPAIYVHWNGGLESVLAYLDAAREMGAWSPGDDPEYAMAGLARAITLFLHGVHGDGDLTSMGIGTVGALDVDNGDNGLYIVGPDWTISRRKFSGDLRRSANQLTKREELVRAEIVNRILAAHIAACAAHNE